jgi:hypothetical protein
LIEVDNVVIILHLIHYDFCLETDREFFGGGEHSTVRSPWRNTRGIPALSAIMLIAKGMKSYKKLRVSGTLKL